MLYGMVLPEIWHDEQERQEYLLDASCEKPCERLLLEQGVSEAWRGQEIQDAVAYGTGIANNRHGRV